jgi:hypothetical protein
MHQLGFLYFTTRLQRIDNAGDLLDGLFGMEVVERDAYPRSHALPASSAGETRRLPLSVDKGCFFVNLH